MKNIDYEKEILHEMENQQQYATPPTFFEKALTFYQNYRWHSIFLCIILILAFIISVPVHRLGDAAGIKSLAKERIIAETDLKIKEYNKLEDTRDQLNKTIYNLTKAAEEIGDVNIRMKEHEETLAGLTNAIAEAQALSSVLDKQLASKQATQSQIDSMTNITPGVPRTLSAGDYRCPANIKAGTYKISGDEGNILLYDIANSIRLSKKLETLDGHEFTLTISEGEKLKVDKTVKITSMN